MKLRLSAILLIVTAALRLPVGISADSGVLPREELKALNEAIDHADVYRHRHLNQIDSLKRSAMLARTPADKLENLLRISALYRLTNADSAISYAEKACAMSSQEGNTAQEIRSSLALINALSTAGIFTGAKNRYETLNVNTIPRDLRTEYWKTGGMLYSYMLWQTGTDNKYAEDIQKAYKSLTDSLVKNLSKADPVYRRIQIDCMIEEGKYADARKAGEKLLRELKEDDRQYGLTALQLAVVCEYQGDVRQFAAYLAKSAESDVKGCATEGMALPTLANWLYENGALDDAYKFVNFALRDASINSARMRTFAIAQLVPYVDESYRKKIDSQNNVLWIGFISVAVLLAATIVLIVVLVRKNRRIRTDKEKLDKLSKIQESYVGNFITLWSNYAERLDSVSKLVERKLSSGQAEELLRLAKAGKLTGAQDSEDFNKLFDNAFLHMYPNFVTNVNSLLRNDQRIEMKDDGELSPELRIYAFVKLGVEESVKIAQIMRYSVSTVYAYRNRMRNRAIDREGFDIAVTSVGR